MIGLGVVGLGRGFTLTLPALLATPGIALKAACDPRESARARFAQEFSASVYEHLEDLLADPAVAALYIATPQELHAAQAIAAAEAGRHVLVEKPMATTVADCRAMVAAARAANTVLMVGPSHGFDAPVRTAAERIASGDYGAVRMLTALNFTDYVYRPRRLEELNPSLGGGVVLGQGAHQIDVARRLIGAPVREVTAVSGNWDRARPGDGAYTALLRFANGACASLTYSGYAHYDSDELMGWISELGRNKDPAAYGQARRKLKGLSQTEEAQAKLARTFGGSASIAAEPVPSHHEHFGFVLVSCERADIKILPDGIWIFGDERRDFIEIPAPLVPRDQVIAEFVAAVRGERAAIHSGEWGLATTCCCAALALSSTTGRAVCIEEIEST
jgi:phthalate 4,5-cis-dihydrodiol dehydrogenase